MAAKAVDTQEQVERFWPRMQWKHKENAVFWCTKAKAVSEPRKQSRHKAKTVSHGKRGAEEDDEPSERLRAWVDVEPMCHVLIRSHTFTHGFVLIEAGATGYSTREEKRGAEAGERRRESRKTEKDTEKDRVLYEEKREKDGTGLLERRDMKDTEKDRRAYGEKREVRDEGTDLLERLAGGARGHDPGEVREDVDGHRGCHLKKTPGGVKESRWKVTKRQ